MSITATAPARNAAVPPASPAGETPAPRSTAPTNDVPPSQISPERACHIAPSPKDLLKQIDLPKDFSTRIHIPDDQAALLEKFEPTCDSLKLKKQLTTLHLQTASLNHASLALAKLVQLTDSKKPEVARRACMSLLKLAHLHNTKPLFPDDNDPIFPEDDEEETGSMGSRIQGSKPQNPTPTSKPAVRDGGATPLPFQTSAFTLQPSPPSPFHRS